MLVAFRTSKFVDTKDFVKSSIAEKATTAEMIVMATTPSRLDREHCVHVVDRDGEYPL